MRGHWILNRDWRCGEVRGSCWETESGRLRIRGLYRHIGDKNPANGCRFLEPDRTLTSRYWTYVLCYLADYKVLLESPAGGAWPAFGGDCGNCTGGG